MNNVLDEQGLNKALPNATAILVLGILSILGCFCYGLVGFVLSIIALILASKDTKLYNSNPGVYTESSMSNLRAGKICAIIGLVLSLLFFVYIIFIISLIGLEALRSGDVNQIMEALKDLQ